MHLPGIRATKNYSRQIIKFGGLNLTNDRYEGEFADCSGISHIGFPMITQKRKMKRIGEYTNPCAMTIGKKECVADNGKLYYDGREVCELSAGKKKIVCMGIYVLVFPDGIYYNTETKKSGLMSGEKTFGSVNVTFTQSSISVPQTSVEITSENSEITIKSTESIYVFDSVSTNDGIVDLSWSLLKSVTQMNTDDIFIDKCEKNQYRKFISYSWDDELNLYVVKSELVTVRNILDGCFSEFRVGDVLEISGCLKDENNKTAIIKEIADRTLTFSEGEFTACTETSIVTLKRKIPDFSCVCAYENRLWGCENNVIYASKLGDPFNFFVYNGLSTDSYTVTSNTAGDFIACIPYGNCCMFFKENSCFKLYGNKPSNFQLTQSTSGGVVKGSEKSVASADGKVFFNGNGGLYLFYGGIPQLISDKLEGMKLENAACASDGKNCYIAADTGNGRKLFVYDTDRGLWSAAGDTTAFEIIYGNGKIYAVCDDGIYEILPEPDCECEWFVRFHPFDEKYFRSKNYSRICITANLSEGAWLKTEISTDGYKWKTVSTVHGEGRKHINIPMSYRSCNEIHIKLSGRGKSEIESMLREFTAN